MSAFATIVIALVALLFCVLPRPVSAAAAVLTLAATIVCLALGQGDAAFALSIWPLLLTYIHLLTPPRRRPAHHEPPATAEQP